MKKGKFQMKPIVIEAYQTDEEMFYSTSRGTLKSDRGDWIITSVNGEQYPCKPDIFKKMYEQVV